MVPYYQTDPRTTQTIPYSLRRREIGSRILIYFMQNNNSRKLVKKQRLLKQIGKSPFRFGNFSGVIKSERRVADLASA